ncbi:hypothetical protein MMA231_00982 [Asticcacaulis sp. MM231]|uniref:phage baseplate assembly protein V n=1 Tax=Asticcacaulis sp. MM231 TaxID=3157666 RepID=UPI0032D592B4
MNDRLLRPIKDRLNLMLGRAIVRLVKDSGALQLIQADRSADEPADDLERFGWYGFHSVPHEGAEAIVASLGGSRSHGVVIACEDRRYRLTGMAAGEVALADDLGQVVYLTRDGLRITSPLKIDIELPEVTVTTNVYTVDADQTSFFGDVSIGGNLDVDGNSDLGNGATKFVKLADNSNATTVKAK